MELLDGSIMTIPLPFQTLLQCCFSSVYIRAEFVTERERDLNDVDLGSSDFRLSEFLVRLKGNNLRSTTLNSLARVQDPSTMLFGSVYFFFFSFHLPTLLMEMRLPMPVLLLGGKSHHGVL